jgi:DNA-binding MarR family transcriptional regulator
MSIERSNVDVLRMVFGVTEYLRAHLEHNRPEFCPGKSATISQLKVVSCILKNPDGRIKIKDIADKLGITSGGVSQIIDNLVRDGLVVRQTSDEDRRVSWVVLSESGKNRRRLIEEFMNNLIDEAMADVPEEKRQIFSDVLTTLYSRLGVMLKQ